MIPSPKVLSDELRDRLIDLWDRTGDAELGQMAARGADGAATAEPGSEPTDAVSTVLMSCFQRCGDSQVFALLFELNETRFRAAIRAKLRRWGNRIDAEDVLQESFLNMFRYSNRFVADSADSFRNWAHRVVHNTLLKLLGRQSRADRATALDEQLDRVDPQVPQPDRAAEDAETARSVDCAFVLFLALYRAHYEALSERERHALMMVEVDGIPYRDAAHVIGVCVNNFKMLVFRARKKIFRGVLQSLTHLDMVQDVATRDQAHAGDPVRRDPSVVAN